MTDNRNRGDLKTQADAVIYFLQRLDLEMLDAILEERNYQEFPKAVFLDKLARCFEEFRAAGDTFLNCYRGCCNDESCNFDCPGYTFAGGHSKNFMDLIMIVEDGMVQDIYECGQFINFANVPTLKSRIRINRFETPDDYPDPK